LAGVFLRNLDEPRESFEASYRLIMFRHTHPTGELVFKRFNLKLGPILIANTSTELASLSFIPEAAKYFID